MIDGFEDPLHVAKAAMAMKRVCDVSGWKTSTAAYHQAVHDHLTALTAERDALKAEVERLKKHLCDFGALLAEPVATHATPEWRQMRTAAIAALRDPDT